MHAFYIAMKINDLELYIYIHLNEPNKENNDEVAEEHIH